MRILVLVGVCAALAGAVVAVAQVGKVTAVAAGVPADSCTGCHQNLPQRLSAPTAGMADDVHAKRGLSCSSCHGGRSDRFGMDAHDRAAGYVGAPRPAQVPAFCARCHSNTALVRQFNPRLPTDQFARYQTSRHGQLLRQGDTNVATCTSCHGIHPVRAVADSQSPVFASNVPATCARCHADTDRMARYGIPTTQFGEYRQSVHGQALLERGNRQAPACNDCHDNHGAVPPGATSVANVCAQCHSATRDLFVRSPHKDAFDILGVAECTACHGTHNIAFPTDAMIGAEAGSVCLQCHPAGSTGLAGAAEVRASLERIKSVIAAAEGILSQAARAGMDVSDAQIDADEARTQLILARAVTHTASPQALAQPTAAGVAAAERARQVGVGALAEVAFRRRGLVLSLVAIALVALVLWLRLRTMERRA